MWSISGEEMWVNQEDIYNLPTKKESKDKQSPKDSSIKFNSVDDLLTELTKVSGMKDTYQNKLWLLYTISIDGRNSIYCKSNDSNIAIIRKGNVVDISQFEKMIYSNNIRIDYVDVSKRKVYGKTFNNPRDSFYRKYWDYESELRFLYFRVDGYKNLYINFTGTEVLVKNDSGFNKFKTTIEDSVEFMSNLQVVRDSLTTNKWGACRTPFQDLLAYSKSWNHEKRED